jgi:hypothetical protein
MDAETSQTCPSSSTTSHPSILVPVQVAGNVAAQGPGVHAFTGITTPRSRSSASACIFIASGYRQVVQECCIEWNFVGLFGYSESGNKCKLELTKRIEHTLNENLWQLWGYSVALEHAIWRRVEEAPALRPAWHHSEMNESKKWKNEPLHQI